jgi:segregation and condensation protein A
VEVSQAIFAIKTDAFEGPLELLIELVEKRKLLINDISLAVVTDEYMQTVSAMQELSLPNTAQFINLAATLLLIKSRSLLPVLTLSEEEESSIENLEERLRLYQLYREIAEEVKNNFGSKIMYEPEYVPPREPIFLPDRFCSELALCDALRDVISNLPKPNERPTAVVKSTISLEDMIKNLKLRIEREIQMKFSTIRADEVEHKNVIVSFLAILELFKQGDIVVKQTGQFSDIEFELQTTPIPRYF